MKPQLSLVSIKRLCVPVLRRAGVKRASVFGSYATGLAKKSSDVDILFTPPTHFGLFELVDLSQKLEKVLGTSVDLVTERALHPLLKKRVKQEAKKIL